MKKVDTLYEAGIEMNGQIVLCRGINDGEELECDHSAICRSYLPVLQSVSVVPVGLTRYREGLYPLEPFRKEDARRGDRYHREVAAEDCMRSSGFHFIHASDEWYLLAEEELPEEETVRRISAAGERRGDASASAVMSSRRH